MVEVRSQLKQLVMEQRLVVGLELQVPQQVQHQVIQQELELELVLVLLRLLVLV